MYFVKMVADKLRIKKMFIVFNFIFAFGVLTAQANGLRLQGEKLADVVTDYLKVNQQTGIKVSDLRREMQQEAAKHDLDLCFECDERNVCSGKEYNFSGIHTLTGSKICDICVNKRNDGSSAVSVGLDPNNDGCIKAAEDEKLHVGQSLETVFMKSGRNLYIAEAADLVGADKNVYKIIQKPSLYQEVSGPCGYYALNNLLKECTGNTSCSCLLNRAEFDQFYDEVRGYNEYKLAVSNIAMRDIIENKLTQLCKKNVMVSVEDINHYNILHERNVITFGGGTAMDRVKDFQENGTPQYIVASTSERGSIPGLRLYWDNIDDRLYSTDNHWLAIKIEWADENRPGKCPVHITVFDSSGPKDNRFSAIVHWYYYVFAHSIV
ncbi:hypothetical protein ACFLYU_03425 [Candidatus Dependentiae bacterium]